MNDKFSAIVLDIDGTLLNSYGQITDNTLYALQECANKNILLYIATARPQRLVFRPSEVPSDADFLIERGVFYNGAVAIDKTLGYSKSWMMPSEITSSVTKYLIEEIPDIYIAIQRKDETHSFLQPFSDDDLQGWGITRNELIPFDKASQDECSKIVAWHKTKNMTGMYHALMDRYGDNINVFITDSASWIQVMSNEASKESALIDLFSLRGISPDDVIVFGDDMPDIGMLGYFGYSVAMGNAPESIKGIAKYITLSNDEDGIVYALREYFGII